MFAQVWDMTADRMYYAYGGFGLGKMPGASKWFYDADYMKNRFGQKIELWTPKKPIILLDYSQCFI